MTIVPPADRSIVDPSEDPYLPGAARAGIVPRHYALDLSVRLRNNRLTGTAVITGRIPATTRELVLDLVGLRVKKALIDGKPAERVKQTRTHLILTSKHDLPRNAEAAVTVVYEGSPGPRRGLWGEVGWEELTDGVLVAGQPNGAPTWFPCVDHPSHKATFEIAVWTDAGYRAIANGQLVDTARKGSAHRWVYRENHPTSTYLAALQIGRYDVVEHADRVGFAASHALARQARAALADQPAMFALFERCFGPYPFESYTSVVSDDELEIPLEAMEMSLFGANHLTSEWESQRLIAHEMAHQWWGNSVTLRQWKDLWLHEGFACYAEWLWAEESGRATAEAEAARAYAGLALKPQDLVLADPGPEDMFDDRVYKRGALALHALRTQLGSEAFFAVLTRFQAEFAGGTASTEDFLGLVESLHGPDARAALVPWLADTALPRLP